MKNKKLGIDLQTAKKELGKRWVKFARANVNLTQTALKLKISESKSCKHIGNKIQTFEKIINFQKLIKIQSYIQKRRKNDREIVVYSIARRLQYYQALKIYRLKAKIRAYVPTTSGDITIYFGKPNAEHSEVIDWGGYSKSYKYPKKTRDYHITVNKNWVNMDDELKRCGGLFTLYASANKNFYGYKVNRATWLTKSRGYTFDVQKGYIARHDGENFHAETLAKAIKGLENKIKAVKIDNLKGFGLYRAIAKSKNYVTVATAKRAGMCLPGIKNYISIHPELQKDKINIQAFCHVYLKDKNQDARSVMLSAL
jgi:hypothetical protein